MKLLPYEIWRDIPGYKGLYQVSNIGRVRNKHKNLILIPGKSSRGYLLVCLCKNGIQKTFKVHRLVATAFIPNPDNLPQVNHKDENKLNNNLENLEWCDAKYNSNYGTRNERGARKRFNGKQSKPILQYTLNGEFLTEYPSLSEAGRQTGFNISLICHNCNYRYKTAYGYIWKYKEV